MDWIVRLNDNVNTKVKTFFIIYTGVTNMFLNKNNMHKGMGFDGYLYDACDECESESSLSDICVDFILNELSKNELKNATIKDKKDYW